MNKDLFTYGFLILLLPVLQVSVFNNVDLLGYIDPSFYILFIFIFPFYQNKVVLLLSSFVLGLCIDVLTNDGGIHAFSLVLLAYSRGFILEIVTGKSASDISEMKLREFSFSKLIVWVSILTFVHHFIIFSLEQFSFTNFGSLMLKTTVASTFSIIVIIMSLQLVTRKFSDA